MQMVQGVSMAWSRRKKSKTGSRKKKPKGRWLLFLVLCLFSACVVLWQWEDFAAGLRMHLLPLRGVEEIADVNALDRVGQGSAAVVRVQGIPDYEGRLRVHSGKGVLTCFRMVGFGNRLFVCTDGGLKNPEEVEEVLQGLSLTGSLHPLEGSRFQDALERGLLGERGIRPAAGAWLLLAGSLQGPSLRKAVLLLICALLCIFFLTRFILSLRR